MPSDDPPSGMTGFVRQPDDSRDVIYVPAQSTLKALPNNTYKNLRDSHHLQTTIYNQGDLQSCTANAIASALKYGKNAEYSDQTDHNYEPSRLLIYWYERILKNNGSVPINSDQISILINKLQNPSAITDSDTITDVKGNALSVKTIQGWVKENTTADERNGFKCLTKMGVCSEGTWPYMEVKPDQTPDGKPVDEEKWLNDYLASSDPGKFWVPPSNTVAKAAEYIDPTFSYERIHDVEDRAKANFTPEPGEASSLIEAMECALLEEYPIVFGFYFIQGTLEKMNTKDYPGFLFDFASAANYQHAYVGHATLCVGYDRPNKKFQVLNSWGAKWGDQGYFWLPYSYFDQTTGWWQGNSDTHHWTLADDLWVVKAARPFEYWDRISKLT